MAGLADQLRLLVAYDEWANQKVIGAAAAVADEDRRRPRGIAGDGVMGVLAHVLGAQRAWMRRCDWPLPEIDLATWDGLVAAYAAMQHAMRDWVSSMSDDDLQQVIAFEDSKGMARALPLWEIVAHIVNHGTQHRAEVGLVLGELGASPGDVDLPIFLYARQAGELS